MKKKVCTVTLCGLLALSELLAVSADAETPDTLQEEARSEASQMDFIIQAVLEAGKQEVLDMQSNVIKNFLTASDAYDKLKEEEQGQLPENIRAGMLAIREQIGENLHSCEGISASSQAWYARIDVTDGADWETVKARLKEMYPSASPSLAYYKDIHYTDIRTENAYLPYLNGDYEISLAFPVPEGYYNMANPQVFTFMDGELLNIVPEENGQGNFQIRRAGFLTNVIVVDLPIALAGISLEAEAGVNTGQEIALQVSPLPQDVTESYEVEWISSDPLVAQVDAQGVVTGKKTGIALITATVRGTDFMAACRVTVVQGAHSLEISLEQAAKETKAYMLSIDKSPTVGSEWFVTGLARSGMDLNDSYFATFYNHYANYLEENKGVLTNNKYTEYSKAIIAMTAIGKDARDIAGYNLFRPLADFEQVKAQGINGPIWAMIALHSNPEYAIPQVSGVREQTTEQGLIEYILSQEKPGGGWSLSGGSGDPDMTGMALQALAPYYQRDGYKEVTAAINRALDYLSAVQNPTGGFSTAGNETIESCVQVLTGLCALGIDPEQDGRFLKGGHWLVENLLSYHIAGSGFMHVKPGVDGNGGGEGGELNGMSTEQGYYAMTAYQRLKAGQTSLYDMSDLSVKGGEKGDGTGTGLVTPPPARITSTPAPTRPYTGTSSPESSVNPNSTVGTSAANTPAPTRQATSTYSTVSRTAAAPTATPTLTPTPTPGARSKSVSKNSVNTQEDTGGWNFEGAVYEEEADGWDFEGAEESTEAEEIVGAIKELLEDAQTDTQPSKKTLPPLGTGAAGGFLGAAVLEGGRYLHNKKKERKKP